MRLLLPLSIHLYVMICVFSNKSFLSCVFSAGAYQVKWNRVTNNLFATTHEGDIRIWDPRVRENEREEGEVGQSKIEREQ